jgi:uncharacterized protein DUF6950
VRPGLAEFLRASAAREFRYGEFDCGLWLADWFIAATGRPDPVAHRRGHSRKDLGNQMRVVVRSLGLARTASPEPGDIGLISLAKHHCTGAIFSTSWIVLAEGGGLTIVNPCRVARRIVWRMP